MAGATVKLLPSRRVLCTHTPSKAFGHLPPNSARFGYAIEGTLFISAQLSTDVVSALRKVRVLICRSNLAPKHARKHETHPLRVKKKNSISIQTIVFLFVLV